jgi:hypothetical protein
MATATQETANQSKTRPQREFCRHYYQESVIAAAGSFGYGIKFEILHTLAPQALEAPPTANSKKSLRTTTFTAGWSGSTGPPTVHPGNGKKPACTTT